MPATVRPSRRGSPSSTAFRPRIPRAFPPSPGMAADAAELLDWVSRLVPQRPPVTDATSAVPPPSFRCGRRRARSKAPAPQLALVKRPAPVPDFAELAYETREWTPGDRTFSASLYEGYALQTIHFAEAQPHPTKLVQSAAMAAVAPPRPSYRPLSAAAARSPPASCPTRSSRASSMPAKRMPPSRRFLHRRRDL